MATITSTGIGTGLNINELVRSMVNAQAAPKTAQLDRLKASTDSSISAYGQLTSALEAFTTSLKEINTAYGLLASIPVMTSINADNSRIDLIDLQNWMRATYKDLGFLSLGGRTVLPKVGSSTYTFAEQSILGWAHQFACKNPRRGGYISGLTVPF